jgi:tRNA (cmo5U34)-methyltransferase
MENSGEYQLADARKRALYQEIHGILDVGGVFLNAEHVASPTPRVEAMFDNAMAEHLYERRREQGEDVTLEQVHRGYLERPDRAANILVLVEDQCRWLREIGFRDVGLLLEILRAGDLWGSEMRV